MPFLPLTFELCPTSPSPTGRTWTRMISLVTLAITLGTATGLAAQPGATAVAPRPATAAITILAPGSAGVQSLSSAYTLSFPHWVLDDTNGPSRIPTKGDEGGWVQPFSLDELWLASDLPVGRRGAHHTTQLKSSHSQTIPHPTSLHRRHRVRGWRLGRW